MKITIKGDVNLCGQDLDILCTAEVEPGCEPKAFDDPGYGPSIAHAEVLDHKSRTVLALSPAQEIALDGMIMERFYEEDEE